MRLRLVDAVLRGEKTATASLREMYEQYTSEPLPRAGERFALVGYSDEPCGTVEVTQVEVMALDEVGLQFAIDEGEGFARIQDWRAADFGTGHLVVSAAVPSWCATGSASSDRS